MLPSIEINEEPEIIIESEEEEEEQEEEEEEVEDIFIEEPEPILNITPKKKTRKPMSDERRLKNIENLKKAREAKKKKKEPIKKEILSVSNNHKENDLNSDDDMLFIKEEIKKIKKEKEMDLLKKELNKVKKKTRAPRKKKVVIEPTPIKQEESFIIKNFGSYSNNLF